ncbi:MAG: 16S rRNA (uracil(1498)-N(3))-methyltransferase [Pseudomonadota bacterium]
MNIVLFHPDEGDGERGRLQLGDRRFEHIAKVHRAAVGDSLRVGQIGGFQGSATVTQLDSRGVTLDYQLDTPPPAPLPLTLVLALPRPKVLRRCLQTVTALGVKKVVLINSYRVEKSYWQTPFLEPASLHQQILLGLEQARDTIAPEILLKKRFKPFVEDELDALCGDSLRLVAHPAGEQPCPVDLGGQNATLAIGPEGGFIPYEVDKLAETGFRPVTLGPRILKVESALPAIIGRLFPGK